MHETLRFETWEVARATHWIQSMINERRRFPGTKEKPIGDPSDVRVMEKLLKLIYAAEVK